MHIKYHFKTFIKAIRSTYMCIRYPFLYPRNRWTGKHYNNWKLHQYHINNYKKGTGHLCVHIYNESGVSDTIRKMLSLTYKDNDGVMYSTYIKEDSGELFLLRNGEKMLSKKLPRLSDGESNVIPTVLFYNGKDVDPWIYAIYPDDIPLGFVNRFHTLNYTKNYWIRFKVWFADFLNDYVLQLFYCIPTFTEWDAMEELRGWNKAFGKKLLKDMKEQLKKDKMLYKFRITDLKEKYGELRIYCNGASEEMYKLFAKYERISEVTCIECGKPARYISNGYICPYCEDCIDKRNIYADVDEEGKITYR